MTVRISETNSPHPPQYEVIIGLSSYEAMSIPCRLLEGGSADTDHEVREIIGGLCKAAGMIPF